MPISDLNKKTIFKFKWVTLSKLLEYDSSEHNHAQVFALHSKGESNKSQLHRLQQLTLGLYTDVSVGLVCNSIVSQETNSHVTQKLINP